MRDILQRQITRLVTAGFPRADAAIDVDVIARHLLGWDRATLLLQRHEPPPELFEARLAPLVGRRATREPVAYIVGSREFWGLELEVTPAVLIPRPETELVVEIALSRLAGVGRPVRLLDVGTGSGCLAVALAHAHPNARVVATDVSRSALAVARRNIVRHALDDRVQLLCADLLDAFAERSFADVIVSNPPYIAEASPDVDDAVRAFEPAGALFAGTDGLSHIDRLVASAGRVLRPGGWLVFEFGVDQADAIRMRLSGAWTGLDIRRDLQGIPRVVAAALA